MPPTPRFADSLPAPKRAELDALGLDAAWFDRQDDVLRGTVLNLYAKLRHCGLWHFVDRHADPTPGAFNFLVRDVERLRNTLRERDDFLVQTGDPPSWQARELRFHGSLHLKHFDGWPEDKVHAHIDPTGALLRTSWWLLAPVPLFQLARHALDPRGYQDVTRVRRILARQGILRESQEKAVETTPARSRAAADDPVDS